MAAPASHNLGMSQITKQTAELIPTHWSGLNLVYLVIALKFYAKENVWSRTCFHLSCGRPSFPFITLPPSLSLSLERVMGRHFLSLAIREGDQSLTQGWQLQKNMLNYTKMLIQKKLLKYLGMRSIFTLLDVRMSNRQAGNIGSVFRWLATAT